MVRKVDWAAVRRLYETSPGSYAQIARRAGVHPDTMRKHAVAENWTRAVSASPQSDRGDQAAMWRARRKAALEHVEDALARAVAGFADALGAPLGEADAAGLGEARREHALKAVDQCLKAVERVMELKKRDAEEAAAAPSDLMTAEQMRAELERRFARMRDAQNAAHGRTRDLRAAPFAHRARAGRHPRL